LRTGEQPTTDRSRTVKGAKDDPGMTIKGRWMLWYEVKKEVPTIRA
jgi:hypothetical protein